MVRLKEIENAEIKIFYRYCDIDKQHQYMVVCKESDYGYNDWIYWIWYNMGQSFPKKRNFLLLPFKIGWDEKVKLIKQYKTCNSGTDRVAPAILNHFKKVK